MKGSQNRDKMPSATHCPNAVPASGLFWSSIEPFMVVFLNNIHQKTYRINVIDPFKR